jgi:transcriptional regulator with XRE-family HTH domain
MERGSDTDTIITTTGAMIRFFRTQEGLSIAALATQAGVSPTHLQRIERGQGNFSFVKLIRIARALGVTVADLCPDGMGHEVGPDELRTLMREVPQPIFQAICHLLMLCKQPHDHEGPTPS